MRKNAVFLFITSVIFASAVFGCGRRDQDYLNDNSAGSANTEGNLSVEQTGTESVPDTENSSQLQLGTAVGIPAGFEGQLAETDAHERLEKVIAEYCSVPEENYADVRYYYNYTDLNGDGKNEILAFVLGRQIEGLDGSLLLWLDGADTDKVSSDDVKQVFRQVGTPIYISSHMTQGYRDLILTEDQNAVGSAGRASDQTYILLTWKGDKYQEPEEGTALFSLEGYEGNAILTNNIESDRINDNYHFLGEAMR